MTLATEQWGEGDEVALLLHGMAGSARSWWQVGPLLARHGFRVVAVDLPGHGRSTPDPDATPESFVDALVSSVPRRSRLVVGHSMGGSVLARAVAGHLLEPEAAVYVEAPFSTPPLTITRDQLRSRYEQHQASRTEAWYRRNRPAMAVGDIEAEAEASRTWDVETATSLSWHATGRTVDLDTNTPSLIVRADPSETIDADAAESLRGRGFSVRSMPGAGHDVWPGRATDFVDLIIDWLDD